ncbi:MAG: PEP-CTERM sorting domain-containing protein [Cyanobacteria bacterium J06638_28]
MNNRILGLGALAAMSTLAVAAESVQAAGITFDLRGSNQTSSSIGYSSAEGLNLTVTAFDDAAPASVARRGGMGAGAGLGVSSGPGSRPGQIDGSDSTEALRFTFDDVVRILSATFVRVQNNDEFTLIADGQEVVSQGDPDNGVPFGLNTVGTVFDFTVGESNDDYRLQAVEVEVVPEPLTLLGTAAAAGVGIVLKRKRSATA